MAKTYLDQLVEYPAKVISRISEDKYCVGFLVNKEFDQLTDEDFDRVLDENVFDYQYVDNTTQESAAYIWAVINRFLAFEIRHWMTFGLYTLSSSCISLMILLSKLRESV